MGMQRVMLVLPAYNEASGIENILSKVLDTPWESMDVTMEVIIVDDGSTDATTSVVEQYSRQLTITVLRHAVNLGLGMTIRDGLQLASERADNETVIVTMDADDTQPISVIPDLIAKCANGFDVVVASRFQIGSRVVGLSAARRVLSAGVAILMKTVFPIAGIRDYTCGFRAYKASVIKSAFKTFQSDFIVCPGFTAMADILLKLRLLSPKPVFGEVPFELGYDRKIGKSKMRVLQTVGTTLKVIFRRRCGLLN